MVQDSMTDRLANHGLSERLGIPMSSLQILALLLEKSHLTSKQISQNSSLTLAQVASGLRLWRFRGWVEPVGLYGKSTTWGLALSSSHIIQVLSNEIQHQHLLLNDAIRSIDRWLENNPKMREIHQADPSSK